MIEITLGGKERKLKFSHIAIKTMERHFGMSFQKIFDSVDMESVGNIGVMIWACMKRYDKSLTLEEVEEMLDDALDDEEVTYTELGDIIKEVFQNSTIAKQGGGKSTKNKKGA